MMMIGLYVTAVGVGLLALAPAGGSLADLEWRLAVVGVGCGLVTAPASAAAVSDVAPSHTGIASAVYNASRQIGATLGVAGVGAVVGATDAVGFAASLDRGLWVVCVLLAVVASACTLVWARSRADV